MLVLWAPLWPWNMRRRCPLVGEWVAPAVNHRANQNSIFGDVRNARTIDNRLSAGEHAFAEY